MRTMLMTAVVALVLSAPAARAFPKELEAMAVEFLKADPSANYFTSQGYDPWVKTMRTKEQADFTEAMFGNIVTGSLADTHATIKQFGAKYGPMLGIPADKDPLEGYRLFREFRHDSGKWLQYAPHKSGLDDVSALMTYVFRNDGTLCAVMGRYKPITGAVPAGLAKKTAIAKARAAIKERFPTQEVHVSGPVKISECLVDHPTDESKLVRLVGVTLDVGTPPTAKRALMLSDGAVQWVEDARYHATGTVFANEPETDAETTTTGDLPDIVKPDSFWRSYVIDGKDIKPDPARAETRATSFFGHFAEKPFEPDPSQPFAEVNIYHHLAKGLAKVREGGVSEDELAPFLPLYYDHWYSPDCEYLVPDETKIKKKSVLDAKWKDWNACLDQGQNNAWFSPSTAKLYFSSNNPDAVRKEMPNGLRIDKHPGYEASTIVHELGHWTHYILNKHHDLTGTWKANLEARSCAEAVADVLSALTCGDTTIANYYLGDQKRDITQQKKYLEVLPIWDGPVPADEKGATLHNASLAFSSAYWKLKGDLGEALALKVLIGAMRVCHLPGRFQNMALATLAMDQLLNPAPLGKRAVETYRAQDIIQGFYAHK